MSECWPRAPARVTRLSDATEDLMRNGRRTHGNSSPPTRAGSSHQPADKWIACSVIACALAICITCVSSADSAISDENIINSVGPLLATQWGMWEPHNNYAPLYTATTVPANRRNRLGKPARLGCLSVAMAQIAYHHGLVPIGQQSYDCKFDGNTVYRISETFLPFSIGQWRQIAAKAVGASDERIAQTARFCYYAALVVRKNFGDGDGAYVGSFFETRQEIREHYGATVSRGTAAEADELGWSDETTCASVEQLIRYELNAGRPVLFFAHDPRESGVRGPFPHWMVIDGYGEKKGKVSDFCVHINFGFGNDGGWFALWKDIEFAGVKFSKSRNFISIWPGGLPLGLSWALTTVLQKWIHRLSAATLPFVEKVRLAGSGLFSEHTFSRALQFARDGADFANILLGSVLVGTGDEGAVMAIGDSNMGTEVRWYAHDPWPDPDPMPFDVSQGETICIAFRLENLLLGSAVRDDTAHITVVRTGSGNTLEIVDLHMIPFDSDAQEYRLCLETTDLASGTYVLYLETSRDAVSRRLEIQIDTH